MSGLIYINIQNLLQFFITEMQNTGIGKDKPF